jgi:alkylhydroperoxidase family enzyme
MPRIAPARPPFAPAIQERLDRIMPPGVPPLTLFTTLARDTRLFERFMAGSLLDRGHLTLRQRELVIDRITALSGSEYEWGVHIAFFGPRVGLTPTETHALVHGGSADPVWGEEDRLLLEACESLHATCRIDDALWERLSARFTDMAMVELAMLAGQYRMVSYLTNVMRLEPEAFAPRFPPA